MAQGTRVGTFIVPIPGAKSRKHLDENVGAADIVLTADDLVEVDRYRAARRRVRYTLSEGTDGPN